MTIRVPDFGASAKAYAARSKGRQIPFKRGEDVIEFGNYVQKHHSINGLTTETYLLDPKDDKEVLNIIQQCTRTSSMKAKVQAREFADKFDEMSKDNRSAILSIFRTPLSQLCLRRLIFVPMSLTQSLFGG